MSRGIGIGFGMGIAIRPKKEDIDPILVALDSYTTWVKTMMIDYIYRLNDHGLPYWRANLAEVNEVATRLQNDPIYSVYYSRTDANWFFWTIQYKSIQDTYAVFSTPVRMCFGVIGNSQVYASYPAKTVTTPIIVLVSESSLHTSNKRFESFLMTTPDTNDVFGGVIPYSDVTIPITSIRFYHSTRYYKYMKISKAIAITIRESINATGIEDIKNNNFYNVGMTSLLLQNNNFPTNVIDRLLIELNEFYEANVPTASVFTLQLTGAYMGIPTGAGNNVDLLGIIAKFTAAGKTANIVVRTV